jgi:hypothetical protein
LTKKNYQVIPDCVQELNQLQQRIALGAARLA